MTVPFSTQYYPEPSGGADLTANSVDASHIVNGSITTADIADHAVTYDKIAVNAVTNTRIANNAVTHAKMASDAIETHNIKDAMVTDAKLAKIKVMLMIHNSVDSTVNLNYGVYLRDNNTSVLYFAYPAQPIPPGSSHSLLLNLSSSATIVEVQVDSDGITVVAHEVYSGGTETEWQDDTLKFTRNAGADNIQIAFGVSDN
ncbi:hypothetical protein [Chrysochromulina parva virophage Larry]|nr:hypothetical protein [Chrysochromulina parva virophage Larry]